MKAIKIIYWISTILISLMLLMGGVMQLIHSEQMKASFQLLGYPEYTMTILGSAKILAAIAFLVPGFPKIREWAYAGTTFLYIGATWSHLAANDAAQSFGAILSFVFMITSYITWKRLQTRQAGVLKPVKA